MQISLILGIILGFASVIVGMILKGANIAALINPAAATIIFVGIFATLLNTYSSTDIKRIPGIIGILFKKNTQNMPDTIAEIVELSNTARRNGLLALESALTADNTPFLVQGLQMVIDGVAADQVKEILENEIDTIEDRHSRGANIFKTAGTTSPTLGVLGAVIGLIGALGHLNDITALGHSISAAFVATLYGIFFGYVLFIPFGERLKQASKAELLEREVILEGILSIQAGLPAKTIEKKLYSMIDDTYSEE